MKCFLDMDGVLSDFVGAACRVHELTCYDKPEHIGRFDMEKIWGMTLEQFWRPTNDWHFWAELEKTAEADTIVELATKTFGEKNIAILTSPSLDPSCVPAKRHWVKKYYPQFAKNMIFSYGKGMLADPGRVLIDDRDRNVEDFNAAGGFGVLVPRLWNVRHRLANDPMKSVLADLNVATKMRWMNV